MQTTEAVVIGAGPYGLAISAFLRGLNIDHVIVGRPMDTWRSHMPAGMCLKSEPYASCIATPQQGYDVADYCRSKGLEYVHRVGPGTTLLSRERFLGYADWFTERQVPDVRDLTVSDVTPVDGWFIVAFDDAPPVAARQVIVATGVLPYAHIPDTLTGLPSGLVSHTSEHFDLSRFSGARVGVIGAGQSATETSALLNEAGAEVHIIARKPALSWGDPNPEPSGPFSGLRRPVTRLCEGWRCAFWNTPSSFRLLPERMRLDKARSVLGPSGIWWLRDRVEGVVDVHTSQQVRTAEALSDGVRLHLSDTTIDVDHVMAGTGFRVDLRRLPFLKGKLLASITTVHGYPVLSRAGESSVRGLYFAGAHSAVSLGPSGRFIAGTHNIASQMARSIARRTRSGASTPAPQPVATTAAGEA